MPLLEISELSVHFTTETAPIQAVRSLSLRLAAGELLLLAGESGAGKSALLRSIPRLLPPRGQITGGEILFDGQPLHQMSERSLSALRGREIGMILQDATSGFDPSMTVGAQLVEGLRLHFPHENAKAAAISALEQAGLCPGERYFAQHPLRLSGGERQRAAAALALSLRPRLLLADEPTASLDPPVRAQLLSLLGQLRDNGTAVLLVSHDLSAASVADRVAVLYAGKLLETGTPSELFGNPRHPYTKALLGAHPGRTAPGEPLASIPGTPPDMRHPPIGDPFAPRDPLATAQDLAEEPPLFLVGGSHYAACWSCAPPEGGAPE